MEFDIKKLELADVPGLPALFEDAAREVLELINEADAFETSGDRIRPEINMKVIFEYDVKTGHATIVSSCGTKRPKRKAISRAVHVRKGAFYIEPDHPDQVVMFNNRDKE